MQSSANVPVARDVVLVGGGHSHVQVIKRFAMSPMPGVRLTLISNDFRSPYSGMLPGCVAGTYTADDIHIELPRLCSWAGARFMCADVDGLALADHQVLMAGRPPLRYDLLSINSGAVPKPPQSGVMTVKPISRFLPKWDAVMDNLVPGCHVVLVGAGAGGVELAFAMRAVTRERDLPVAITVVSNELLAGHNERARQLVARELVRQQISFRQGRVATESQAGITLESGEILNADVVLWSTSVEAPGWIASSGIQTDQQGFISVNGYLQSISHPRVFAAGDIAHLVGQERPKSGVYAVRAGPYLAENLRRAVTGRRLKRFRAQKQHLALLGLGNGRALASRGRHASLNRFWWWLKRRIDVNFMNKFNELPEMSKAETNIPEAFADELPDPAMRCGGCGAKLAAEPLRRVLSRLQLPSTHNGTSALVRGIGDDAAELIVPVGRQILSIDGFRSMVDDPYLFGRIATHHSLNDLFAMAAQPVGAMVLVTVPLASEAVIEEELYQVMSGVVDVLRQHDVMLLGGHSAEGQELSLGLSVNGIPGNVTLGKDGARPGDRLILTKPLGSGVVLAAAMQGQASADSLRATLNHLDQSNAKAVDPLVRHGATALTDVTGFGLLGHLGEMLRAAGVGASVNLSDVPVLPGACALMTTHESSLQQANEQVFQDIELQGKHRFADPAVRILADPQTSGGLLATVAGERAPQLLQELGELGFAAHDIGQITNSGWVIR